MALLIYNEKTKRFENKMGGLQDLLNPFAVAESASALIGYATDQFKSVVEKVNSTGSLSKDDSENIKTIIEEGRKQKVDELNIEMSRDVAMGMNVNGIKGADVTFGSKGKTKYVMNVKYKYDN